MTTSAGFDRCLIASGFRVFWIATLVCWVTGCNTGSQFPARPVTLICPWSAGGGTDRLARQVAVLLEAELGVPVNVVNATGGGGVTGHTRGALARPDGYTLTIGTVELNMLHHRGLSAVGPTDFEPLGLLNQDSAAIFVRSDSTWTSPADLEQSIAATQRPLKASGTAAGGIWHVAMIGWLARQELPTDKVTWISINGAAPSLQELMAGGIDLVSCSVPEAKALLEAGEIRCLGVMSPQRLPASPEILTFAEQGIDWSLGSWRGLLYPHGVPPDRLKTMQAAVRTVSRSDEFARFMQQSGFHMSLAEPHAFTAFLDTTDRRFGKTLSTPVFAEAGKAVVGAWFFPSLLGGLALLVITLGFQSLGEADSGGTVRNGPIIGVVAGVLAFVGLSPVVGYVIATGMLLGGLMLAFQASWRTAAVVTLAAPLLLFQIFSRFLGVPLPWGWLGW
ncbi:tripartite tricarboxylate transporter substrate-binding protein [Aureliella helgolandensis]|uniref:Tripartite tricarboxylate transporter family receptor n=1 Tax=Aureliella helgolandensis TaxID=2527968 RepID=A0A518GA77_9BACT|nr:tripartite tricarboxylate transporter substrate-binding protein [Aureliella helgolandensis]QDV25497.1 Tripartite tricarboxylate transporter family receptor [Aureliella helgolandensis]